MLFCLWQAATKAQIHMQTIWKREKEKKTKTKSTKCYLWSDHASPHTFTPRTSQVSTLKIQAPSDHTHSRLLCFYSHVTSPLLHVSPPLHSDFLKPPSARMWIGDTLGEAFALHLLLHVDTMCPWASPEETVLECIYTCNFIWLRALRWWSDHRKGISMAGEARCHCHHCHTFQQVNLGSDRAGLFTLVTNKNGGDVCSGWVYSESYHTEAMMRENKDHFWEQISRTPNAAAGHWWALNTQHIVVDLLLP